MFADAKYRSFLWGVVKHTYHIGNYRETWSALLEIVFPGRADRHARRLLHKARQKPR